MTDTPYVLECNTVVKRFREGDSELEVLSGVDLKISAGERIAIVGASGSGKTTLLQIMGGLDEPTEGRVVVGGQPIAGVDEVTRGQLRNKYLGFVYQFHHLLPEFSAAENVAMPLMIRGVTRTEALSLAGELLGRVGLAERLSHKPAELSGGERQRAAVARALITQPALVLADEPTGNLDTANGSQVLELMLSLNREMATSLVIVTHDSGIANRMDRILTLESGTLAEATVRNPN